MFGSREKTKKIAPAFVSCGLGGPGVSCPIGIGVPARDVA